MNTPYIPLRMSMKDLFGENYMPNFLYQNKNRFPI